MIDLSDRLTCKKIFFCENNLESKQVMTELCDRNLKYYPGPQNQSYDVCRNGLNQ